MTTPTHRSKQIPAIFVCLVALAAGAATADKVEEGKALAQELGAQLDQLAKIPGRLDGFKGTDEELAAIVAEAREILARVDRQAEKIGRWLDEGDDAKAKEASERLGDAIDDADGELAVEKATPYRIVSALGEVDDAGRKVASILGTTY
ncbi:MAG: hypothetical protein R3325_00735 [Thermoanaerobaculia bacterium]|nr:hypothetical protein [Thermoanaerobaculia bacterium]